MSTPPSSPGTNPSPGSYTLSVGAGSGSTPSLGTNPNPGSGASSAGASSGSMSQATVTTGPSHAAERIIKRSKDELRNHGGLYNEDIIKDKYTSRGSKECIQWVESVTLGIEAKFSTVKNDAIEAEQFESVYDLSMRVAELQSFVKQNGLITSFDIFDVDVEGRIIPSTSRNLLEDYANITLDEVKISTRAIQEWGADYKVWAETIATKLVSRSCDADLRQRVTEKMIDVDEYELGGATYLKMALECITSMSHSTVSMALSIKMSTMTIQQFHGENVIAVISALRGATQRLKMSNMLPPHMPIILYCIFQSSTCEKFNNFFAALYAREEADVMLLGQSKRLPSETLFRIAEHQYRTMLEDGTWTIVGKKVSSFNTEGKPTADLPPWKTPPKAGEPTEREFKGRIEYWCDKCGWNRTHPAGQHRL